MPRTANKAQLGWLHSLNEVGRPVTDMADQELRLLAEVADLQRAIAARRKSLRALRVKAQAEVTSCGWTATHVADAQAIAASATPSRTCLYTKGCPLSASHTGSCCPPGKAAVVTGAGY